MSKRSVLLGIRASMALLGACAVACTPTAGPKTGTQTNWLSGCRTDADCGDLHCVCGACTESCGDDTNCVGLPGASCVAAADDRAVAMCDGSRPTSLGVCLLPCPREGCPEGTSCVSGVCSPVPEASAHVAVDSTRRFQTLVGIGASLGYVVDEIGQHPRKSALLDAMFAESGFSALRLRNRHGQDGEEVAPVAEIAEAARQHMDEAGILILNSPSPPGALKANGSNWCEGNPDTCTLATLGDGSFDYAGFAAHWRASLDAYADVGVFPDYISIQNNPDWVPPTGDRNEACRFLPSEGTASVVTDNGEEQIAYPGYAEALEAVLDQLDGLASVPRIVAPATTGMEEVAEYVAALDMDTVDAIAHHMYGSDAANLDLETLAGLAELGERHQRPLFQTEMHDGPLATAVLMHASFTAENAAVYVQNGFVASAHDVQPVGLINLTADDFELTDWYHVLRHYSGHIGPGWERVDASSDTNDLLASAWVSPDEETMAIVLVNPGTASQAVELEFNASWEATAVIRTVLSGVERSARLGELSAEGIVAVPGQAIVTIMARQ